MSDQQIPRLTIKLRVEKRKASRKTKTSPRLEQVKSEETVPSYLQRSEADASSDTNRKTLFVVFPCEIIQEILSYLRLESVICLTLTCKLALHVLGTSSWEDETIRKRRRRDPPTKLVPRRSFLELLSRDVEGTGWVFCKACNTLHPPPKRPSEHHKTKLTKCCWGPDGIVDYLPQGEDGLGYSLVWPHIKVAMTSTSLDSTEPIDYLSGSFLVPHPYLNYTVSSSARRVNGNLILRHDYNFSPLLPEPPLKATDIIDLPFRICPHQTTSRDPPPENNYTDSKLNGPLLTHSIVSAFPVSKRTNAPESDAFRKPTPVESRLMASAGNDEEIIFRCRFCPTKWRVAYARGNKSDRRDELIVAVFHCFYKQLSSAARYWHWFVRREGVSLGRERRNSEFWSPGRFYRDFKMD
ncbi:hypothetical protein F5Y06DRAFT_181572 [Hypoxylon sp. FL0890]|nr:hypothetical protein F5Y06DRAFT_181572 [Hypoxylon sp. FL0890]